MRRILAQFLLVRFAGIFLFVLFTLTSLLVLFDLLAHADDLAVNHRETLLPMACYACLRLPVLLAMITPMCALLAALVTFERLASQYELVALQGAGVSMYQVCLILLLGGIAVAVLHFGLAVNVVPPAEARLFRWAERNYQGLPGRAVLEPGPAWFAAGAFQTHISNARDDGRLLDTVLLIERDEPGSIMAYYEAREARYDGSGWTLMNGWKQSITDGQRQGFARLPLALPLDPEQVTQVRLPVSSLDFAALRALSAKPAGSAAFPSWHYKAWIGRRLAEPLGSLVMILLAAPLGLQLKRSGRQLQWGSIALGLGFLFFIIERLLLAFGESGALAPSLAVWGPLAVFGLVGIILLSMLQK
ncbi:MAG: LptF/LptG family permease [Opitutaceae bacterium]|nr:LptF/LptG family permease [Opitutaceae bacterium]